MAIADPIEYLDELNISKKVRNFILDCISKGVSIEKIGYEFEKTKISDNEKKKKNGQFYTPEYIVEYMIEYLSINSTTKIVDPACGTGSFLLPIIKKLFVDGKLGSIYGIDIDKEALEVLNALIHLQHTKIHSRNLIHGNTIVSNKNLTGLALQLDGIEPNGFDVVIGNPPYVTLKKDIDYDSKDHDFRDLLSGQVNAATLMIAKGLSILKPEGVLAFVLPKNILHVGSYSNLRKYLLAETTILHIVDLRSSFKNVRGEQIILFVQKKKPEEGHRIDFKVMKSAEDAEKNLSVFVEQRSFITANSIYVFERNEDYQLINRLAAMGTSLKTVVHKQIFRGVSISAMVQHSEIIGAPSQYVSYIRGKNIQKFKLVSEVFVDRETPVLKNPKIQKILNRKLVVQNIFSSEAGLICAMDDDGILTNETVTNIIIEDSSVGNYLLGLLNSKLVNYYLIYGCYNCSKMTMHTDKEYIGSIPVLFPEVVEVYERVRNIVEVLKAETENKEIIKLKQELDRCFYWIYGLDDAEIKLVESGLDLFLSKKSRW